jgi:hypothetical protein
MIDDIKLLMATYYNTCLLQSSVTTLWIHIMMCYTILISYELITSLL